MLFAVEGGGFFSSSASGYSKGLTFLLLGHKNEDKPMRVSPWNQYQLVDQEPDPDLQLASAKNRLACGCASFVCFRGASAGLDAAQHLKVGPAQHPNHQDSLPGSNVSDEKSYDNRTGYTDEEIDDESKVSLKSSLKKSLKSNEKSGSVGSRNESVKLGEEGRDIPDLAARRKVQWTDACGSELAEIKEFEPSEVDFSDDEFENGTERSCSCAIM